MLLFRPRWLFLYPGFLLFLLGALLIARIWLGPWIVGGVSFDIGTLLYAVSFVLVGFQAVAFAVLSKVFATGEGLMPPDPRIEKLTQSATLELSLAVGLLFCALGIGGTVDAVWRWSQVSFGNLDPLKNMRLAIMSTGSIIFGLQVIFFSFFLGVLRLKLRHLI